MINIFITALVVIVLAAFTALTAAGFPRALRGWVWLAFLEYMLCAAAQLYYSRVVVGGGDTLYYAEVGGELAKFLDANFAWAGREMLSMLLQEPSAFDKLIDTPQSNTGSMFAASAFLLFVLRGADYGVHVLLAGLSMFGAISIYRACMDAYIDAPPVRLFAATVLFPSVAFWTSALHKEAFGLMGIGVLLAAWRAVYQRKVRALLYAPFGVLLIVLFRAPALPPLALGLVVYFAWDRIQKTRGPDTILLGPVYLALALGILALASLAVTKASPTLALDQLSETVNQKQQGWALVRGGSSFDGADDALAQTFTAQLFRLPIALLNALLRPQIFDVHNFASLLSALEMTVLSWLIIRAVRLHGFRGIFARLQQSPFLLMCSVITLVGCTFVGLVTLNFGSLARYRVPFLPFYGALLVSLNPARARAKVLSRPHPKGRLARTSRPAPL